MGSFMSQSSSTSFVNGRRVTTNTMNKNGKEIKEVYEDDELIERFINGKKQNLDAIGDSDNNGNDKKQKKKTKKKKKKQKNRNNKQNMRGNSNNHNYPGYHYQTA
eukprot:238520_1